MSGPEPLRLALHLADTSRERLTAWAELLSRTSVPLRIAAADSAHAAVHERGAPPTPEHLPCLHVSAPVGSFRRAELTEALELCTPMIEEMDFPAAGSWAGEVALSADVAGLCHAILHGAEETRVALHDEHGRFPPEESLLVRNELIDMPVADRLGRSIGTMLWRLANRRERLPEPEWFLCTTLDIDSAGMYRGRALARNLRTVWRTAPGKIPRAIGQAMMVQAGLMEDPHLRLRELAEALEGMDVPAIFFCQTHRRHLLDSYRLSRSPRLVRYLRRILKNEFHHIGLHGSYATRELGRGFLGAQWRQLRRLLGPGIEPVHRAHYLREPAGAPGCKVSVDSTLGFGAREGFRRGTAIPFRLREEEGPPRCLIEAPPTLMDTTLRHFRGMTPQQAWEKGRELMLRVSESGGLFVPLWHPENMEELLWPGWSEVFLDLITEAKRLGARPLPLALAARRADSRFVTIRTDIRRLSSK